VGHDLRWPDGHVVQSAVFTRAEAELPGAEHVSLEDGRVRGLLANLPVFAPGQPVPTIFVPEISDKVHGVWSLWRVSLQSGGQRQQRYLVLFLEDDGRVLLPTARAIWDRLIDLEQGIEPLPNWAEGATADEVYRKARDAAEVQGGPLFDELVKSHAEALERERRKGSHAFEMRRRAIERVGLPQVRAWRLKRLAEDESRWGLELQAQETALPELNCVAMARVELTVESQ
jgi:hypothetical protein